MFCSHKQIQNLGASACMHDRINSIGGDENVEMQHLVDGKEGLTKTVSLSMVCKGWRVHKGKVTQKLPGNICHDMM